MVSIVHYKVKEEEEEEQTYLLRCCLRLGKIVVLRFCVTGAVVLVHDLVYRKKKASVRL